jgi:DNA modification methylase
MKTTKDFKLVSVDKLVPYQNNARTHSPEQINKLRASLREFGFINPIIIDKDYGIIAGHGRLLAAQAEGMTEVPCVFADHLTEAQKKAYIIADNRMALDAGWDEELLRVEIEALQAESFDLALTGFDEKELSKLFDDGTEAEDDDFDVDEELKKPTFTKAGDVWTLGRHRLVCGDSTKPETYETLMQGKKANLVVTDPPYNVNYEGSAGKIQNDNMASEKFYDFLFDAFSNMEKVMANDASIYVFHADTEGLNFRRAFDAAGFYLSGCCIWKKPSLVLGRSPYQWIHEPCLFGWKKTGKHQWYSDRKQTTVWEFEKSKKNAEHPTMKPIPLLSYPIANSSMSNTLVLDPFGGSGSTLIACEQMDRSCYTIELDEKYCDVIVNRYIELKGSAENVSVMRDGAELKYEDVHSV